MKLLLHSCCAPCLEYPNKVLKEENVSYTGYFYNPNIQPEGEYQRRKTTLENFSAMNSVNIIFSDIEDDLKKFDAKSFEEVWNDFPNETRCEHCYRTRLEQAAKFAIENGFNTFSTTLLGSIYQNHSLISSIGHEIASKYGISFYERDFRNGFRDGQIMAKNQGLYRQKFCGCMRSLNDSAFKNKIISSLMLEKMQY